MHVKFYRHILFVLFLFSFAFADVWNVPDSVKTIQAAIDTAASGDTVLVNSAHQNVGPVEIVGKQISLFSKGYLSNPDTYNIATGAALFDTLNTLPQLKISSADSTVLMGFLIDKSDIGNGGGVMIENSAHVLIDGVYFKANSLFIDNSSLALNNTQFYGSEASDHDLISASNSTLIVKKTLIKNSEVDRLIVTGNNSELDVENLAVFNNVCNSELYNIGSSTAYFNYITSYGNSTPGQDWSFGSTWTSIRNSVLEFAPPLDIAHCEINYSAVPGNYPGTGNISLDPLVDSGGAYPALLSASPCISAADPDTAGIPRSDILGNARPNPEWAPPDMGAFESERHMMLNIDHTFWISLEGDDIWGNGSMDYPFASIQAAADYAQDADTLILLPGTYRTHALIESKSLTIASEYLLDNNSAYRDSVILLPDTSESGEIFLVRNVDSLIISGMSMRNGLGRETYNNYSFGGAIYGENSTLYLELLSFNDNKSAYSGGAIYALNSDLYLNNVLFENNVSYFGGAISISSSNAYFAHVKINDNIASSGGGVYLENGSKLTAYYTEITHNSADSEQFDNAFAKPSVISQYGGGIYSIGSNLRLHNALIANNYSVNQGAGVAQKYGAFFLLQSTVADNISSAQSSSALYLNDLSEDALVVNSILFNEGHDEIILEKSDLITDHSFVLEGEAGIVFVDSLNTVTHASLMFGDPGLDDDYNLLPASQAMNAGISSFLFKGNYLIDYDVHEYDGTSPGLGYTGANPDVPFLHEPVISGIEILPETHKLLKAYPNPFNPATILEFYLENEGETNLSIYDIAGRPVSTLVNRNMVRGQYKLEFNARSLPSGIYIARLSQARHVLSTSKLLLVK